MTAAQFLAIGFALGVICGALTIAFAAILIDVFVRAFGLVES